MDCGLEGLKSAVLQEQLQPVPATNLAMDYWSVMPRHVASSKFEPRLYNSALISAILYNIAKGPAM